MRDKELCSVLEAIHSALKRLGNGAENIQNNNWDPEFSSALAEIQEAIEGMGGGVE